MTAPVFVDTNVLVYRRDASEPEKQRQAEAWMENLWRSRRGRLSYQVLHEFYVTVTEKLDPGLGRESARREVRSLWTWRPLPVDARVVEAAWGIQDRYRLSWWDALIAAAAQVSGCRYLLTEDLQEGQELGDLRVVNPFLNPPASLALP
jgi:predicted nucleic acid-binding protein